LYGDSFTAGDGVSNRFRYGDVLEQLIPGVEVLNFALPGTGTDQQYLTWQRHGRDFEADLVVAATNVDHVRRVTGRYRCWSTQGGHLVAMAKPYFAFDGERLDLAHVPVPRALVDPSGIDPEHLLGAQDSAREMDLWREYDAPDRPGWQLLAAIFEHWQRECTLPFVIFTVPTHLHVEGLQPASGYRARFAELGATLDVPVVDALSAIEERDPSSAERRAWRFPLDHHPSRNGHRLLADALAAFVAPLAGR
jgi:carbamoyltransferase